VKKIIFIFLKGRSFFIYDKMGQMANAVSVGKLLINPEHMERLEATAEVHRHICDSICEGFLEHKIPMFSWVAERKVPQTGENVSVSFFNYKVREPYVQISTTRLDKSCILLE
jgi:hypothetical protein